MLSLTVNTNLKEIYSAQVNEVILPTPDGFLGVMTGHLPMISNLSFGEVLIRKNGSYESMIVGGGIAEVFEDKLKILVLYAESPEEIDIDRALKAKERAEKRIVDPEGAWDLDRAMIALTRALTRIRLAGKSEG
ncbi:MAG: ATP synthase F1 subunit epsilon [Candidatus Schekmanbacteria bacterium RBG_13_48_7]|uniref:ATP synthase epsilon chain n=1 Tax=Candidatus Schekmanbacteria bacterium RBG_13_48_7 TaxID=1817878 RepID=A0A1F7RR10_9BACT|nr:MAG: ATP synthase F1 subunit epsilon [Candidatus Schekmanbacteria bacterium RBG_13_48_7]